MSFVFRGTRSGDIESGFPGYIPDQPSQVRFHVVGRPMSYNLLLCLVLGVFLMATGFRMYATCQQLQAHVAAARRLLGHTEFRLHMPPSIAFATSRRLEGLRFQLARLEREFDDFDYEILRSLDSANGSYAESLSEEEINSLPVHKYEIAGRQSESSTVEHASSSVEPEQKMSDTVEPDVNVKSTQDGLTCSVCLDQVIVGESVRRLPCLHQFHANCIDPWLRKQGTCPLCKFRAGTKWQENGESGNAVSCMF
ncbi:hypothetical protein MKW92_052010 [Papaver armeniacum]|nr:hypothetical protein MKW92_052010 [Papaver armeniacum]